MSEFGFEGEFPPSSMEVAESTMVGFAATIGRAGTALHENLPSSMRQSAKDQAVASFVELMSSMMATAGVQQ